MARRPRRFPFVRLGLLLVVGSVFASLIRWYIAFAQAASDFSADDPPAERGAMLRQFAREFLFAGGVPGWLLWIGLGVIMVGIVRNFAASPRD